MQNIFVNLVSGIVVENTLESWTGNVLYSDTEYEEDYSEYPQYSLLDRLAARPLIGVMGGVIRVSLAVLHILAHTLAMIFTFDSRHLIHIAKGGCELLKGVIQSIPLIGHLFSCAWIESFRGMWWMIKIYNPNQPDSLDARTNYWRNLRENRPSAYYSR